ncbi:hypothetical protein SY83_00935 [Paenibacillus swuensis]|uniref:DUF2252 domain-containing protein n=1 Tax=Paenibacillus swuensis TaxID=1178515 RepID=A0A172TDP0_9BACL|nr:DUF2252 family protein [Paenibacillus swuensis]ANE45140.1 hypothetical protein SY83_00935 [Paenibacillus swuensis]
MKSLYSPERIKTTHHLLRTHTITTVLNEFDQEIMKLSPDKRREKYAKMTESVFRFFRGSAYLFYFDVTRIPFTFHTPDDRPTWIQGDLHFENFGAFLDEDREIVYDVNDFDEGYLGSYLYDVLRMSVSIVLVAELRGFDPEDCREAVETYLKSYYKQIRRFAEGKEDPTRIRYTEDETTGVIRKLLKKLNKRSVTHLLDGVTDVADNHRRFKSTSELESVGEDQRALLTSAWTEYYSSLDAQLKKEEGFYGIKDVVVKHASGTASIGLDRYYMLIEGGREHGALDDLVLEAKEVRAPVPAYFLPHNDQFWTLFPHQGKRVIMTQRAMHHKADPFLGHFTLGGDHYYVRERSPYKKRVKLEAIETMDDLTTMVKTMGQITAKMHARADRDTEHTLMPYHSEEEIVRAIGKDDEAFVSQLSFAALTYAKQVHSDYEIFCKWTATSDPT